MITKDQARKIVITKNNGRSITRSETSGDVYIFTLTPSIDDFFDTNMRWVDGHGQYGVYNPVVNIAEANKNETSR
nr:MAG TPA: Kinetochore protein [Caudoviricetes sp.]